MAKVRLGGATSFLGLAAFLGYGRGMADWKVYVPLLATYTAVAAGLLASARSQRLRLLTGLAIPLVDVPAVGALQMTSLPLSPFPAGVAGWSLGLFVMLVMLAALSFRREAVYAATATGWVGEGILQRAADVGWGAVVASGVVLVMTAGVAVWATRRLEGLVSGLVNEEAARRRAIERNEELEEANRTIAQVNRDLLAAQHESKTLSSMLVHDMKSPLSGVLAALQNLELDLAEAPESKDMLVDVQLARAAGERLLGMIGDLLSISRLEQGALPVNRAAHRLDDILDSVVRSHGTVARYKGVELARAGDGAVTANLDRELLLRLLDNLVSNALRFVHGGHRIELWGGVSGSEVVLAVRNNGPEIPADVRGQLFSRFSPVGRERGSHNVGLGLYFCRLAADAHGGSIACEDAPGWPVSFVVRLPVAVVG
jgi:two-component system, OmpR family, heavy metal sensor histidine kinase CusS